MLKKFKNWGFEIILIIIAIFGLIFGAKLNTKYNQKPVEMLQLEKLSSSILNKTCTIKLSNENALIQQNKNRLLIKSNNIKMLFVDKTVFINDSKDSLGIKVKVNKNNESKVLNLMGLTNKIEPKNCIKNTNILFKDISNKNYINLTPFIK